MHPLSSILAPSQLLKPPWVYPGRSIWDQKSKLTTKTAFLTKIPVNRHPTCNISFIFNFGPPLPFWNPLGSTLWFRIDSNTKFDINNVLLTEIPISRHPTCHTIVDFNFAPFLFVKPPYGLPRGTLWPPILIKKMVFSVQISILVQKMSNLTEKRGKLVNIWKGFKIAILDPL